METESISKKSEHIKMKLAQVKESLWKKISDKYKNMKELPPKKSYAENNSIPHGLVVKSHKVKTELKLIVIIIEP